MIKLWEKNGKKNITIATSQTIHLLYTKSKQGNQWSLSTLDLGKVDENARY